MFIEQILIERFWELFKLSSSWIEFGFTILVSILYELDKRVLQWN